MGIGGLDTSRSRDGTGALPEKLGCAAEVRFPAAEMLFRSNRGAPSAATGLIGDHFHRTSGEPEPTRLRRIRHL